MYADPAAMLSRALSLIQKWVGWCLILAGSGTSPPRKRLVLLLMEPPPAAVAVAAIGPCPAALRSCRVIIRGMCLFGMELQLIR